RRGRAPRSRQAPARPRDAAAADPAEGDLARILIRRAGNMVNEKTMLSSSTSSLSFLTALAPMQRGGETPGAATADGSFAALLNGLSGTAAEGEAVAEGPADAPITALAQGIGALTKQPKGEFSAQLDMT